MRQIVSAVASTSLTLFRGLTWHRTPFIAIIARQMAKSHKQFIAHPYTTRPDRNDAARTTL